MHSGWRSDRGTVTAEFALLLPVLVAVLILAVGALSLVSMQISNTVSVGEWARSLARGGDLSTIVQQVERSKPDAHASMVTGDGVLCLKLSETVTIPLWSSLIPRLEVSSCVPIP